MQEAPSRTFTWPFVATLAAIGGAAAAAGVFLGWWQATSYRESEIFGRELVEEQTIAGTAHWSGTVALVAGVVVIGAAVAGLFLAAGGRRSAAIAVMVAGVLIAATALFGATQAASVAEAELAASGLVVEGSISGGLFLSAAGGAVAVIAGFLDLRSEG